LPISAIVKYIFDHLLPILAIDMTKTVVRVGMNGRAQIPYDVRTKLGIRDGYQLVIDIEQIIPAEGEVDSEGHNLNDQRRKEA